MRYLPQKPNRRGVLFIAMAILVAVVTTRNTRAQATSIVYNASDTFTVPAGVTQLTVHCWGGGGGGGAGVGDGGGGGGGGAYARAVLTSVPGSNYTVTVGGGGAGGLDASSTPGSPGGDSWFISTSDVLAKGGSGGAETGTGGAGGLSGSCVGDVSYSGGAGAGNSGGGGKDGGGGGGSAYTNAAGGNATTTTGGAGTGAGGDAELAGNAPGGGGGAGGRGVDGAAGAAGRVTVEWIPPNTAPTTTAPTNSAQATDGSGNITLGTDVDDAEDEDCKLRVEYSVDGKVTWTNAFIAAASVAVDYGATPNINNGAATYQIGDSTPIKTTNGANTVSFVWDTQNAGNGESTITTDSVAAVWIRVKANDGTEDGDWTTNASSFAIDNLAPAVSSAIALSDTTPTSGDTSFSLDVVWTEGNPDTNMFGYKLNGAGSYTEEAGDANTATPASKTFSVTLNGTNTFTSIRCVHTDDFGNTATSEDTTVVYVCPTSPVAPTVNNPSDNTLDVSISTNLTPGLLYAIQCTNDNTYVQSDGTLGGSIYWTNMTAWGATKEVSGLSASTTYGFRVAAGNPNDGTPTTGENSASAFGADDSAATTTPSTAPTTTAPTTGRHGWTKPRL